MDEFLNIDVSAHGLTNRFFFKKTKKTIFQPLVYSLIYISTHQQQVSL